MLSKIELVKNTVFAFANSRGNHFIKPTPSSYFGWSSSSDPSVLFSIFSPNQTKSVTVYCYNVSCLLICLPIIPQHTLPFLLGLCVKALASLTDLLRWTSQRWYRAGSYHWTVLGCHTHRNLFVYVQVRCLALSRKFSIRHRSSEGLFSRLIWQKSQQSVESYNCSFIFSMNVHMSQSQTIFWMRTIHWTPQTFVVTIPQWRFHRTQDLTDTCRIQSDFSRKTNMEGDQRHQGTVLACVWHQKTKKE